MKKRVVILGLVLAVAVIAVAVVVSYPARKAQAELNSCVANLKQLDGAAMSHCLENKLSFDQVIPLEKISPYLKGYTAPICPSGKAPYLPFDVLHGPRCPNSEGHGRRWIVDTCQKERAAVWDAALCHAAARGLFWADTVDPRKIDASFYRGKCTGTCPLDTNGYPPFVLSEGPRCPHSLEHNAESVHPWRNCEFFDEKGRARTNLSLSKVSTNAYHEWLQQQRQMERR